MRGRDSSIGTATRLRARKLGFDYRQGQETFLFSVVSRVGVSGAHPASYLGALSPVVKRGGEADYSPLSSAEVRNSEAIPPLPSAFITYGLTT
jgi:hypothetical protein